jgi:hypothetical protein
MNPNNNSLCSEGVGHTTDTFAAENSPPESEEGSTRGGSTPKYSGHSRAQSLNTANTLAGARNQRRVFAHAGNTTASKQAGIIVEEVKDDKKKKGMKSLFSRKK